MTLSIPLSRRSHRASDLERSRFGKLTIVDAIFIAILLGPLTVLQVAGRTPSVYWVDVVVAASAVAAFAKMCARPGPDSFRLPPVMLWAVAYALIAAASMLLSDDLLASIALLKLRLVPIAVFLLAYGHARGPSEIEGFQRSLVWFGCLLAAIALYNWYGFSSGSQALSEEFGPKDMLQLSFGRSNYLGSIFVLIIPTIVAFVRMRKGTGSSVAYFGALLLVSIALIFTQSRGALISVSVGFIVWGLLTLARAFTARRVVAMLLAIGLVSLAAAFFWDRLPDDVRVNLSTAFNVLWSDARQGNYGGGRTELWAAAIKGAWESNLLGIGLGNQAIVYLQGGLTPSAHNLYLETLLETGIVGLVALSGVLYGFGVTLLRLWRRCVPGDRPLVGALLATFVTALVNAVQEPSFWGPQYSCLFWMMMGVAYSWSRLETRAVVSGKTGREPPPLTT